MTRPSGMVFAFWLVIAGASSVGRAADPVDPNLWRDSPGYVVSVSGSSAAFAEVFHSPDFQRLLVLPDRGDAAYLLGLADKSVEEIARADAAIGDEGVTLPSRERGRRLDPFERAGPDLTFTADSVKIILSPAQPLLGETTLATLLARKQEYEASAKEYVPSPDALRAIRACDQPTEIIAFFGTWCPICKKRMPAFIRTIEDAANPRLAVRYICVDSKFTEPLDLLRQFDVHRTPTIVVRRDGREIGRIDKAPAVTLEQSLAEILAAKG